MTADLAPLSFERLLDWIRRERAALGTVFGLHEDLLLDDLGGQPFALPRRGHVLDTPVGVAAGPHTQLSHNLVAAWLCGARFLELKTVQVLDELAIARPCIDMADEGYNCEWSQELPIAVSGSQYLDAWVAIRLLQQAAGTLAADEPGFVMDLSVGYDLAGVRSAKVQGFLDRFADSRDEVTARLAAARPWFPHALEIPVPEGVADSVTLSTMHGCPPDEIERIACFLMQERGLDTTVKLNPTLLGADEVRGLLNDTLGFPAEVPDEAFQHDLAWDAALDLVRSLTGVAARCGRRFAVKLTNTLECRNTRGVLPASEPMSYLSGRALHPISVRTAARLQESLDGRLDISFAGGADAGNVSWLVASGLSPVTVCSDLLRPGGYQRLHQYLDNLAGAMSAVGAGSIDQLIRRSAATPGLDTAAAALANLQAYAGQVARNHAYQRRTFPDRTIKTDRALGAFDCIAAPCAHTCPAGQDVPEYLHLTARGDFDAALAVVLRDNPLPTVTGMVCDHPCLERCTRVNYEAPVRIRDVKRTLAHRAPDPGLPVPLPDTGRRVAIVGAGPAGLACAYHLALAGVRTTVFEAKAFAGGMITDAIPAFRLSQADFDRDLARLAALGVELRTGAAVDRARLDQLRRDHDAVMLGIGAQADRPLGIPGEALPGVWPALRFLSAARRGPAPDVGRDVVVIGGGNTAMDAARTASRLATSGGTVTLVYRRTVAQMPAAREELRAIQDEGVVIRELLSPVRIEAAAGGLALVCQPMELGPDDPSGRPRPVPADGAPVAIGCDTVVTAVGQLTPGDLLAATDVHVGGDALRGPATLVAAMGDGRRAARAMLAAFGLPDVAPAPRTPRDLDDAGWQDRAARLQAPVTPPLRRSAGHGDFDLIIGELSLTEAQIEAGRCLDCADRCDVCVSVCPDRANLAYTTARRRWPLSRVVPTDDGYRLEADGEFVVAQARQTANLVDLCNECGNCATFCPTAGAPYRDKPRVALSRASFAATPGAHLITRTGTTLTIDHGNRSLARRGDQLIYETPAGRVMLAADTFAVASAEVRAPVDLRPAAALAVLLDGLADHPAVLREDD
ncbi:MAG: FAD-dependent oxidoreductase [Candidatus Krumholzibacteriia bacterium]